jgi:type IV secretion system protein TrbL
MPAHASNILDQVGQTYQGAASSWEGSLFAIAKSLFVKLALIELLWFGIWWTIERDDPRNFLVALLRKMMALLFFWAILLNFDTWIPAIISGFTQAGQTAAGTGALTPSTVLDRGLEIATTITTTANNIGLLDGVSGIGKYLLAGLAALGILLAFGVIAGQMLVTLIESYIVVNAGVLFLGFAGSRWTTTFAEKFLSYAVSVGVKLFVTYLIIGAGQHISDTWASTITTDMVVSDYLTILVGALVYMFLAWQIPSLASSMLTGAVSMTLGSAMATAGTMAAGALGAAGAATAAVGGTVNGVAGAVKAGSAAINQAKEKGATSLAGIAGGAVGALAGGVAEAAGERIKGLGADSAGGSLANRIDNKTAAIRESNAASSVSAPSAPGAQPAAPAAPAGSPSGDGGAAAAPGASQGGDAPSGGTAAASTAATETGEATRATPAAPGGTGSSTAGQPAAPAAAAGTTTGTAAPAGGDAATASSSTPAAPAAPTSSIIDTSGDINAAKAARDAGQTGMPAAPAAPAEAPAPAAEASAATTESAAAPAADSAPASSSTPAAPAAAPAPAPAQQPQQPAQDKDKQGVFQTLAQHAESLGNTPNDSAAGAGVQINLKHHE